jgi:hypothetical protein
MAGNEDKANRSDLKWCQGIRFTGEDCIAKDKMDDVKSEWFPNRVRFTGEYCNGIVSGLGVGVAMFAYLLHFQCVQSFSFLIGTAGAFIGGVSAEFVRLSQREQRGRREADTDRAGMKPKWYHLRRDELTGEYVGGMISGFGVGAAVMAGVCVNHMLNPGWTLAMVFGLMLAAIGSSIHRHMQPQRTQDSDVRD